MSERPLDTKGRQIELGPWYWARSRTGQVAGVGKFLAAIGSGELSFYINGTGYPEDNFRDYERADEPFASPTPPTPPGELPTCRLCRGTGGIHCPDCTPLPDAGEVERLRNQVFAMMLEHDGGGDTESQAAAWRAVFKALWDGGMCQFISSDGRGRTRALEFIRQLLAAQSAKEAAERDEAKAKLAHYPVAMMERRDVEKLLRQQLEAAERERDAYKAIIEAATLESADTVSAKAMRAKFCERNDKLTAAEQRLAEVVGLLQAAVGGVGHLARTTGVNVAEWEAWEAKARAAIAKESA